MKIKEWMTSSVVTVNPETSVKQAFLLMKKHGYRHLPVVRGDKLVGFVADRDLRRPEISDVFREWNDLYRLSDDIHVEDVMRTNVMSVTPETDLVSGATILIDKKISALPVVEPGDSHKLVGIITIHDFLKALVKCIQK